MKERIATAIEVKTSKGDTVKVGLLKNQLKGVNGYISRLCSQRERFAQEYFGNEVNTDPKEMRRAISEAQRKQFLLKNSMTGYTRRIRYLGEQLNLLSVQERAEGGLEKYIVKLESHMQLVPRKKGYTERCAIDIEKVTRSLAIDSDEESIFSPEMRDAFRRDAVHFLRGEIGVHAEMKVLDHLIKCSPQMEGVKFLYIGITKLCCIDCEAVINVLNDKVSGYKPISWLEPICRRGTHLHSYIWKLPPFLRSDNKLEELYLQEKMELSKRVSGGQSEDPPYSVSPKDGNKGRRGITESDAIPWSLGEESTTGITSITHVEKELGREKDEGKGQGPT